METGNLNGPRNAFTATFLSNGKVLVVGGRGDCCYDELRSAELYDIGLGFTSDSQPVINAATIASQNRVRLTGSRFNGISGADSSGSQDSATSYPVVQLRRIDNSQVTYLLTDPLRGWSDLSFGSLPARGVAPGPALATVFTNGIPSDAKYLVVTQ